MVKCTKCRPLSITNMCLNICLQQTFFLMWSSCEDLLWGLVFQFCVKLCAYVLLFKLRSFFFKKKKNSFSILDWYVLSKIYPMNRMLMIESKEKSTTTAGFEPARETPRDFESLALTTRPNCLSWSLATAGSLSSNASSIFQALQYLKNQTFLCST